ncbi:MAG: type 4a pilus biogenesis protein PilO [Deltaproteobacteria bacterium]|nr:type 4a pilus biogenesis protein PilO [Deltaproteobacteria bacterium]
MALDAETIKTGYIKLPDYQKTLISAALMLLLGGLYFYLFYMDKMDEVEGLQQKLTGLQSKVNQVRAVADELPRFEAENKIVSEKLAQALKQLPGSDEIPALLVNMEKMGDQSGIVFESIILQKEKAKDFYAEVPIKLTIKGTYHDTAIFFDNISKLPRIINISRISIGKPKNLGGRLELSIDCMATTYKFIEKKNVPANKRKK